MSSLNARLIEKEIFSGITAAEPGDSEIVDLNGATKFSCQAIYDVSAPGAKTFDSPAVAYLVNQSLTYTAVDDGTAGNDITIALTSPGSGTHALAVSTVGPAISVSLQSTAAVAASGALDLTADITLTSVATGAARNTTTFETIVSAAAANPTDTVLVTFAGSAAAITCTIVPNNGDNNGAVPVDLTTEELTELINTGAVVGVNVTLSDVSARRILQTATGGDTTPFAHGGEGDGVTATFANGVNFALVSTGNEVKTAVNADAGALLLVLVTGTNASAVTTLTATHLAHGVDSEVDVPDSTISIPSHGFTTGLKTRLTTTGTLPAPFTTGVDYFVIVVDADIIQLAASEDDAETGTFIVIEDEGANASVNTVTATSLAGASITFQKSNSTDGPWINVQAATTITVDGSVMLEQPDVSYRYFKAVKAITAGVVDLQALILVIGPAV